MSRHVPRIGDLVLAALVVAAMAVMPSAHARTGCGAGVTLTKRTACRSGHDSAGECRGCVRHRRPPRTRAPVLLEQVGLGAKAERR